MIRAKAHLFTLLAAVWTVFTLLGVFFFREYGRTGVDIAIIIWVLHTAFIALSIYFWITEQPKSVLLDEGDKDQEDVSPSKKRKRTFGSRLILPSSAHFLPCSHTLQFMPEKSESAEESQRIILFLPKNQSVFGLV